MCRERVRGYLIMKVIRTNARSTGDRAKGANMRGTHVGKVHKQMLVPVGLAADKHGVLRGILVPPPTDLAALQEEEVASVL